VCITFILPKLHKSLLEVGRKAKHHCLGEITNTIEWFEGTIWGEVWAKFSIANVIKTPRMLHRGQWWLGVNTVPLFNRSRRHGRHFKIHKVWGMPWLRMKMVRNGWKRYYDIEKWKWLVRDISTFTIKEYKNGWKWLWNQLKLIIFLVKK
jgi:hypothetical protein